MLYQHETNLNQRDKAMAAPKIINWTNATTLLAVAILVGTEFVGTAWAAGWALGGLFQLDATTSHIIEAIFALMGLACLYYFMRAAIAAEPVYR